MKRPVSSLLAVLFTASLSSLAFELTLLRVFSITLWHHFAFMVISIALFGIAASGAALTLFPKLKDGLLVPLYSLLLGACILFSYILANAIPFDPARISWDPLQILYIGLYALALSFPFFCFGIIAAVSYSVMSAKSGQVYASDLVGAGAGALASLALLSLQGPEKSVLILAALPSAAASIYGSKKTRIAAVALITVLGGLMITDTGLVRLNISQYKPLSMALLFPGARHIETRYSPYSRVDIFESPAARSAPGLSLRYLDPLPRQTGIAIDAGEIHAVTDQKDGSRLAFLDYLPSRLPYLMSSNQDVLIIDPRAGLQVIAAERYGAKSIYSVDSNPLVLNTVRDFTGRTAPGLYAEKTWAGLARARLVGRDERFDIIDLSLTGAAPAGGFGFLEDYRFTVEAMRDYMDHLKQGGFLSLNLFLVPPPRIELRLLATIVAAAEELGIKDVSSNIAAIRSWGTMTIVFKRSSLTPADVRKLRDFCERMRFDPVLYPGMRNEEAGRFIKTRGTNHYIIFRNLISGEMRAGFVQNYLFDIRPVRDDRPFFHYFLKLENIREIYRVMGEKWQFFIEEGYLLPVLFIEMLVLGAMLIIAPLVRMRGKDAAGGRRRPAVFIYFASLGLAFMFIEVSLIQRMILPLENPPYAASAVILSLLVSSGMGGMMSARIVALKSGRILVFLAGLIVLYVLTIPWTVGLISHFSLPVKLMLVFVIIAPMGLLMGIPFPLGMSLLGRTDPNLIPWAWAVNGCLSVVSPVLAVMIALASGFSMVLLIGAALYLSAFFALRVLLPSLPSSERMRPE